MKKNQSLSLFLLIFSLAAPPADATQLLEYSSTHSTSIDLCVPDERPPFAMKKVDENSQACLEAVTTGELQKLHFLLWDRSKSAKIVSAYGLKASSKVHLPLAIKRLICDFVCLFEDANEIKGENGENLLHTACMFPSAQSIPIVELILTLNINVNAQSQYGQTALHYLCQHRFHSAWEHHIVAMFDLILKKGGSCLIKNNSEENPLHTLCNQRFSSVPLSLELLKRFKGKKEVINAVNTSGMTPLHILCSNASSYGVSQAKKTCIRTLFIDVKKVTYYQVWKRSRCEEGIRYLLTHGGHPSLRIQADVPNQRGYTPYELARKAGFHEPCLCCGIVCCNEKIPLPCFSLSISKKCTAKDLLATVDPLGDSTCPKLSYCCWATRTDTKFIITMWVSVVTAAIGFVLIYL